ncbi:hypothetical protein Pelo_6368 [Pelomyxa schiedti]|nr:hypothetical protein Pelo_6368 [Pelomyxa schiedti]
MAKPTTQYTRDQLESMSTYNNNADPSGGEMLLNPEMQRQLDLALEAFAEAQSNAKKIALEAAATALASSGGNPALLPAPDGTQPPSTPSETEGFYRGPGRSRYAPPSPQGSAPALGMGRGGTHFMHPGGHYDQSRADRGMGRAWPSRDHYSREDHGTKPPYTGPPSTPPYHNNPWRRSPWRSEHPGSPQHQDLQDLPSGNATPSGEGTTGDIQLRPHRAIPGVTSPPIDDLQRKNRLGDDNDKKGEMELSGVTKPEVTSPNTRRWEQPGINASHAAEAKSLPTIQNDADLREKRDPKEIEDREKKEEMERKAKEAHEREEWERNERSRIQQKVEEELQKQMQQQMEQMRLEREKREAEIRQKEEELKKWQEDMEKQQKAVAEEQLRLYLIKQREESEKAEREREERERQEKERAEKERMERERRERAERIERERREKLEQENIEREKREKSEREERERIERERQMQQQMHLQQQQLLMQQQLQQQQLQRQQQQQQQNILRRINSPPPPAQMPTEILSLIPPSERVFSSPKSPERVAPVQTQTSPSGSYQPPYVPYSPPQPEKPEQPLTSWVPDPAISVMSGPKRDPSPSWPMMQQGAPQQTHLINNVVQPPRPKELEESLTPALVKILNTPINVNSSPVPVPSPEQTVQHPRFTVQVIRPPVRSLNSIMQEEREDQKRRQAQKEAALRLMQQQQQQREAEREAAAAAAAAAEASAAASATATPSAWNRQDGEANSSTTLRDIMAAERKAKNIARETSPTITTSPTTEPTVWGKPSSSPPVKTEEVDVKKKNKPKVVVQVQKKSPTETASSNSTKKNTVTESFWDMDDEPSPKPTVRNKSPHVETEKPIKPQSPWKITTKETPLSLAEIQQAELVRKSKKDTSESHTSNTSAQSPHTQAQVPVKVKAKAQTQAPAPAQTQPQVKAKAKVQVQVNKRVSPAPAPAPTASPTGHQHPISPAPVWGTAVSQNQQLVLNSELFPALGKVKPTEKPVNDYMALTPPEPYIVDWCYRWLHTASPSSDFSGFVSILPSIASAAQLRRHAETHLGALPGGVAHNFSEKYLHKIQDQHQGTKKTKKPKSQQTQPTGTKQKRGNRTVMTDPSLLGFTFAKHTGAMGAADME